MESEGKICRQYEPTAWCSNMTIRETKDKFRICLDPSNTINKAIRVPKHPIPRFEDILPQLNGAKCFSVADVMSGFTNLQLTSRSRIKLGHNIPYTSWQVPVASTALWSLKWLRRVSSETTGSPCRIERHLQHC